jgi:endonuclease/exonuclease/phosphatase family metal-dependent hydrolase
MTRALRPALAFALALAAPPLACSDATTDVPTTPPPAAAVDAGPPPDTTGTAPLHAGTVRVATFNVHLFFDTVCDSGLCGATDFEKAATPAEFDADVARVADAIAKLDADVVAVEEIETQHCLDEVAKRLAQKGIVYPIVHLGETGAAASVDVGILARGTLGEIRTHKDQPIKRPDGTTTTFSRELLEVRLTLADKAMVMFAAHFRSQANDDPTRRLAEAMAAHTIVSGVATELPDALVVLGGDLNDTPGSDPLNALEAAGALVRLAADIPVAAQATYTYAGQGQAIDHLYAPPGTAARYVAGSARVVRDKATGGLGGSDHAALTADLRLD